MISFILFSLLAYVGFSGAITYTADGYSWRGLTKIKDGADWSEKSCATWCASNLKCDAFNYGLSGDVEGMCVQFSYTWRDVQFDGSKPSKIVEDSKFQAGYIMSSPKYGQGHGDMLTDMLPGFKERFGKWRSFRSLYAPRSIYAPRSLYAPRHSLYDERY